MKRYALFIILIHALVTSACSTFIEESQTPVPQAFASDTETAVPVPTRSATSTSAVAQTLPAITPSPTKIPPTARPTNTATRAPTSTPTAVPPVPPADIEILAPGALSKVISPIPVRADLVPGHQGRVTVELLGEDGRVISRQIVLLNPNLGRKVGMVIELPFEIPTEAEFSRLVISVSDEYGRTTALASTDLVLLSSGQPDFNVVVDRSAPVVIQEPPLNAIVQGEGVVVSGMARPAVSKDFVIEMIAQNGKVISQRVFDVEAASPSEHVPFIIEVPFSVDDPTWVLLLIRERGDRIPGITYLTSTEVLLSP